MPRRSTRALSTRSAYRRTSGGCDVAAGERAVELMRKHVDSTRRPESVGGLGGFGGAFSIPAGYREPLMIASTDGVGTKTVIAAAVRRFDTIGIDLVAMCADDVVCTGAEPLAFLDYVAVGLLDPVDVAELVGGVAAGCREAGAALVGGETAEHPGVLEANEFDLAGCCIGVVERSRVIDGSAVVAGDVILGLASSGLHANGFSLVRGADRAVGPGPRRAVPGPAAPDARRRRDGRGDRRRRRTRRWRRSGEVLLTPDPDLRAGRARGARRGRRRRPRPPRSRPHHGRRAARERAARAAGRPRRPPGPGALADAVGHAPDRRARRPGGRRAAGDVQRRARDGRRPAARRPSTPPQAAFAEHGVESRGRRRGGRQPSRSVAPGTWKVRWSRSRERCGRIAVGVSGAGSNLRALQAAADARRARRRDRRWSSRTGRARPSTGPPSRGSTRPSSPDGDDAALAEALAAARPDVVVLAGYMRIVGPAVLGGVRGPDPQHPSVAAAGLPGRARGPRRARARRRGHGRDGPPRRRHARRRPDRGPGGGADPPRRRRGSPARPDPGGRAPAAAAGRGLLLAGALGVADDGRHVTIDLERADARVPTPRRALLSVSDKTGLADLGRGLVARGFELVSTGGTARALRDAGLPVTDVAAVTGSPEMLDGRVKTLHPRVHGGLLADRRLDDHRRQLLGAGIAPFELVVVNLYPFAAALERPGITDRRAHRGDRHRRAVDGPGGGQEPRERRDRDVAGALRRGARGAGQRGRARRPASGASWRSRRSPTPRPTTRGSRRSCPAGSWTPASATRPTTRTRPR